MHCRKERRRLVVLAVEKKWVSLTCSYGRFWYDTGDQTFALRRMSYKSYIDMASPRYVYVRDLLARTCNGWNTYSFRTNTWRVWYLSEKPCEVGVAMHSEQRIHSPDEDNDRVSRPCGNLDGSWFPSNSRKQKYIQGKDNDNDGSWDAVGCAPSSHSYDYIQSHNRHLHRQTCLNTFRSSICSVLRQWIVPVLFHLENKLYKTQ